MAWLQRWRKERAARPGSVWLDREDSERRDQFVKAVRQVRISRSLLKLAWTAGPVTAIGLYGGYYIGFGKPPSTELLIYFISFTILSGLIALVAKVVYDSVHGPELEQAEQDVMDAIDKLGELILAVRIFGVRVELIAKKAARPAIMNF
ncbi:hypothetical protein [Nitrosomonas sp. ANs5]|uniref:hypothetical protein n=1 Tax=Nitrosomonas sp. ANs5 TaxID=3423941 RepID=UPI003D32A2F5